MVNGNSGPKINGANGVRSILFGRMPDGSWTVTTETADGEIEGTGATILEARLAFDERLKKARAQKAIGGVG